MTGFLFLTFIFFSFFSFPVDIICLPGTWKEWLDVIQIMASKDNDKYQMKTPFRDRYRSARTAFLSYTDWIDPKKGTWKTPEMRKKHFPTIRKAVTQWCEPRNSTQARMMMYMLERPIPVNYCLTIFVCSADSASLLEID